MHYDPRDQHNHYEQRQIVKEALKEWLDDKFLMFGKWSAASLAAAGLVAIVYFICWKEFH